MLRNYAMTKLNLNSIGKTLLAVAEEKHSHVQPPELRVVKKIIHDTRSLLLPEFFLCGDDIAEPYSALMYTTYHNLKSQIKAAYDYSGQLDGDATAVCDRFFERLPELQRMLRLDVIAGFDGDPAAKTHGEVALTYPGFFAISVFRMAHELYEMGVPYLPRMMTEYAHGKTGIDINPGATIGESFFIDHGTGIVIGETTTIGNNVKVYQGVTLGALSTRGGQRLANRKRHPTVEDNVTIYAGATILGGDTVLGEGCTVGGCTFITESIPARTTYIR